MVLSDLQVFYYFASLILGMEVMFIIIRWRKYLQNLKTPVDQRKYSQIKWVQRLQRFKYSPIGKRVFQLAYIFMILICVILFVFLFWLFEYGLSEDLLDSLFKTVRQQLETII